MGAVLPDQDRGLGRQILIKAGSEKGLAEWRME